MVYNIRDNIHKLLKYSKKQELPPTGYFEKLPSQIIFNHLMEDSPILVSRLGSVETSSVCGFQKFGKLKPDQIIELQRNAGFYYSNINELSNFVDLTIQGIKSADILAYWDCPGQYSLLNFYAREKIYVKLSDLETYKVGQDWLSNLPVKKICVVSPFINTMKNQIKYLNDIHPKSDFVKHNFVFVRSPQTNASYKYKVGDMTWVEQLSLMKQSVKLLDPDLVLIGAGSYGTPLGGILKKDGYSSVVCGGALQIIFGIRGLRWDAREDYRSLFNDFWTRVIPEETPAGHDDIEGGCYW